MAHFAREPGDQFEIAAGLVAAHIHQLLFRHGMAGKTIGRHMVNVMRPEHPEFFRLGEAVRIILGAVGFIPVQRGSVAGLAGNARNDIDFAVIARLGRVMAVKAEAFLLDAAQAHFRGDLLGLRPAVHAGKRVVMVRQLPSFHHRRMTLRTIFRALGFGGVGMIGDLRAPGHWEQACQQHGREDSGGQKKVFAHKVQVFRSVYFHR